MFVLFQEIAVTSVLRDSLWCLLGPTVQVMFITAYCDFPNSVRIS